MEKIVINPIGVIHSPYKNSKNIPIQGRFKEEDIAYAEVKEEFREGLKDLQEFSHAILIYHFHKMEDEKIIASPYLEKEKHGIFSVRSPYRPNRIGFSIVKIKEVVENKLYFTEVDVLDQTPLIDIKPYVEHFDKRDNVRSGWIEKHFKDGNIPEQTILK
ncbi:MAG: tRNA (N6-threonylcarbamoyladenosine(37)-N6)-methyltransferase TrmO [Bacteroidota bacterium]